MSEKEAFLVNWDREFQTTLRVLKAFPAGKPDMKPHERSMSAKELAWLFVQEQIAIEQLLDDTLSMPPSLPPAPATWEEAVTAYEKRHPQLMDKLRRTTDADLLKTMPLMVGPGKMADVPKTQFLWLILFDQIHHRGQSSVYIRMAGGKVPSIYGPSADEPWM